MQLSQRNFRGRFDQFDITKFKPQKVNGKKITRAKFLQIIQYMVPRTQAMLQQYIENTGEVPTMAKAIAVLQADPRFAQELARAITISTQSVAQNDDGDDSFWGFLGKVLPGIIGLIFPPSGMTPEQYQEWLKQQQENLRRQLQQQQTFMYIALGGGFLLIIVVTIILMQSFKRPALRSA